MLFSNLISYLSSFLFWISGAAIVIADISCNIFFQKMKIKMRYMIIRKRLDIHFCKCYSQTSYLIYHSSYFIFHISIINSSILIPNKIINSKKDLWYKKKARYTFMLNVILKPHILIIIVLIYFSYFHN